MPSLRPPRPTVSIAYGALLVLSGLAGLSYEVVWLRCLSNTLGCSSLATTTILAVFMAGLALGSLIFGRIADRFERPLLLYAGLEGVLALSALAVPRLLGAVEGIDRVAADWGFPALAAKALAAFLVLAVPTIAMGGTLPAIAADIQRRFERSGTAFSIYYGLHVLGAGGGALLASFLLVPSLGLTATSSLGALVNLTVAAGVMVIAWRPCAAPRPVDAAASAPTDAAQPLGATPWIATAFCSGFVLLACEVVFVRTLVLSLMAKVHSFAIMLAVFLMALSVGSFLAARLPRRWIVDPRTLGAVILLGSLGLLVGRSVPLQWPLSFLMTAQASGSIAAADIAAMGVPAFLVELVTNTEPEIQSAEYLAIALLVSSLALFPFAVPLGMVLPIVLRRVAFAGVDSGRLAGKTFFWNTLGAVLGPATAAYVAIPTISLLGTLWIFALLAALGGGAWALRAATSRRARFAWGGGVAVVCGAVLLTEPRFAGTPELDCTLVGAARLFGDGRPPRILAHHEGATGTVTVVESPGGKRGLRLDGFEAAATMDREQLDYLYMRLMAHVPALLHGATPIERALVICCGTGGTAGAMTLHTEGTVDLVDLHPEVMAALPWFEEWNHGVADDPRCRAIVADGRAHLRRQRHEYDIITLEPMPPQFAGMTQLYSVEFYESCRRALKPGGVVCNWLPLHLVTGDQGLAMARAMAEVFPTVQFWRHGGNGMLIGSERDSLPVTRAAVARLLDEPRVRDDLIEGKMEYLTDLVAGFVCHASDLAEVLQSVEPIRDDHPGLEYATISYGLSNPPPDVLAARRDPFYRASLRARPPLEGFDAERAAIERHWLSRAIASYVELLDRQGRHADADAVLERQLTAHPELGALRRLADARAAATPGG